MNFEKDIFDRIIDEDLFYSPKIEIKPAHLANGFFRAVCKKYSDGTIQHKVIHPKAHPSPPELPEFLRAGENKYIREILNALLNADTTIYRDVRFSSYTLSHVTHITSDNHDRRGGEWLCAILELSNQPSITISLLRTMLEEDDRRRSDEISTLTLPVTPEMGTLHPFRPQLKTALLPSSLRIEADGRFADPIINAIHQGFEHLASYDNELARYGGKLDTLRRFTIWGCFALYLHLMNTGRDHASQRVPMLITMPGERLPSLQRASIQSYQAMTRSIDKFFREKILTLVEEMRVNEEDVWNDNKAVENIILSLDWKSASGRMRSKKSDQDNRLDCLRFYKSYRSETADQPPYLAFANAITDMLDRVLSSSPVDVARSLGVRIGLITSPNRPSQRRYLPQPDLLEVLVRASIPPKTSCTFNELAEYWATQYGILFGELGRENQELSAWGITPVDGSELRINTDRLAEILELSGYARRYADGVVIVTVKE